jgi:hypothetical protein
MRLKKPAAAAATTAATHTKLLAAHPAACWVVVVLAFEAERKLVYNQAGSRDVVSSSNVHCCNISASRAKQSLSLSFSN